MGKERNYTQYEYRSKIIKHKTLQYTVFAVNINWHCVHKLTGLYITTSVTGIKTESQKH